MKGWDEKSGQWEGFVISCEPPPDYAPALWWGRVWVRFCPTTNRLWWWEKRAWQAPCLPDRLFCATALILPGEETESRSGAHWCKPHIFTPVIAHNVRLMPEEVAEWLDYEKLISFVLDLPFKHAATLVGGEALWIAPDLERAHNPGFAPPQALSPQGVAVEIVRNRAHKLDLGRDFPVLYLRPTSSPRVYSTYQPRVEKATAVGCGDTHQLVFRDAHGDPAPVLFRRYRWGLLGSVWSPVGGLHVDGVGKVAEEGFVEFVVIKHLFPPLTQDELN